MNSFFLVGAGGALGAMGRYGTSVAFSRLGITGFPYATMAVNVLGSVAMGLLIGFLAHATPAWQGEARLFVAIGLLGGFTTFSAFSLDAVALFERHALLPALGYVVASVVLSILGLFVGLLITRLTLS
ncbi:MAG TPA: CrcB family protein [Devosiaceae bacterium]|nr:CrcB family protein [Devosiaceae bacterium]